MISMVVVRRMVFKGKIIFDQRKHILFFFLLNLRWCRILFICRFWMSNIWLILNRSLKINCRNFIIHNIGCHLYWKFRKQKERNIVFLFFFFLLILKDSCVCVVFFFYWKYVVSGCKWITILIRRKRCEWICLLFNNHYLLFSPSIVHNNQNF
jgi:hypothetical protein